MSADECTDQDPADVATERDALRQEVDDLHRLVERQSDLLTGVANALNGEPPALTSSSHHDLPELAARRVARLAEVEAERDRMYAAAEPLAQAVAQVRRLVDRWHEYADPADLQDDLRAALDTDTNGGSR